MASDSRHAAAAQVVAAAQAVVHLVDFMRVCTKNAIRLHRSREDSNAVLVPRHNLSRETLRLLYLRVHVLGATARLAR